MALVAEHLVGRGEELASLERMLDELDRGHPGAFQLAGEPGIGKTRLLRELAARAEARGHLVLWGAAAELEHDLPFSVFVDALDEYVAGLEPKRLAVLDDQVQAELANVFPALSALAAGRRVAPQHERVYFFRPVAGFPSMGDDLEGSLFSVKIDGSGLTQITPRGLAVEVVGNSGGRLSADGTTIAFTSAGAIWTVRSDGTGARKVFQDSDGRLAITPTWSPDGKWILFGLDPPGSLATVGTAPVNALYVIAADGTELTPVLQSDDWKREPDWVRGS